MQDVGASSLQRKLTVLSENSRKYLEERGSTHDHTAAALRLVPGYFKVRYLYIEGVLSLCWPPSQQMLDGLEFLLLSWWKASGMLGGGSSFLFSRFDNFSSFYSASQRINCFLSVGQKYQP